MSEAVESCPNNPPPPSDPCSTLKQIIGELLFRDKRAPGNSGGRHGLIHRFREQIYGQNGPGTASWRNHEDEIRRQQRNLQEKLREWKDNGCGPPPPGAREWATRPVPRPSQWKGAPTPQPQRMTGIDTDAAVKAGAVVVGTAATGYIIYRVIRFLPSLVPPLWPTIPANLAIP